MRHIAYAGCLGRIFRIFARKHFSVPSNIHALQAAIVFILHFVLFDMSIG